MLTLLSLALLAPLLALVMQVSEDLATPTELSQLLQHRTSQPHPTQPKLATTPLLVALLEAARQAPAAARSPPSSAPEAESAGSRAMPLPPHALWAGQPTGQQHGSTSASHSSATATGTPISQEASAPTPSQPSHVPSAASPHSATASHQGSLAASPPPPPSQAASTFIRALARADSEEGDAAAAAASYAATAAAAPAAAAPAAAAPHSASSYPQSPGHAITPLDDSPSFRRGAAAAGDAGSGPRGAAAAVDAFPASAQGARGAAGQASSAREPAAAAGATGRAVWEPSRPAAADEEADAYAEDSFASASASAAASPAAAPGAVARRSPQQQASPQPQPSTASSTRQGFAVPDSAAVSASAGAEGDAYWGVEEGGADGVADSASVSGSYFRVDPHLVARAAQLRQAQRELLPGSEGSGAQGASGTGLAAAAGAATFDSPADAVGTAASPASPSDSVTRRHEGAAAFGWLARPQAAATPPANEVASPHGDSFGADHPYFGNSSNSSLAADVATGLGSVSTTGAVAGGGAASGGRSSRDRFSGFSSDISSLTPSAGAAPVTQSSSAAGTPTGYAARSVEGEEGAEEDEQTEDRAAASPADEGDADAEAEREHGGYASHAVGRGFRDGRRGASDEHGAAERGGVEEGDVVEREWQRERQQQGGSAAPWAAASVSFQQPAPAGRRSDSVPSITRSLGLQLGPIDLSDIEGGGDAADAAPALAAAASGRQGLAGYALSGAADPHSGVPFHQHSGEDGEHSDGALAHERYQSQHEQQQQQQQHQYQEEEGGEGEGYGWGRDSDGDAAATAHFESRHGHLDSGEEASAQLPHAPESSAASSSFSSSSSGSSSGAPRSLSISRALGLGADLARLAREMHAQAASDEPAAEAGDAAAPSQKGSGGADRHWGDADVAHGSVGAHHHSAEGGESGSLHEEGYYPSHDAAAAGQGDGDAAYTDQGHEEHQEQEQQRHGMGGEGEDAAHLHGSAQRDSEPQERHQLSAATPSPERGHRRETVPRQQRRLELQPASPQDSVSAAASRPDASPSAVSPDRGAEAAATAAAAGVGSPVAACPSGELSAAPSPASAASPTKRSRNRSDVTPILDDGTPDTAAEAPPQAAPHGVGAAGAPPDSPSAEAWRHSSPDGGGVAVEAEEDGAADFSLEGGGAVLRPRLGALEDADAAPAPHSPSSRSHPALRRAAVPAQASETASSSAAVRGGPRAMPMGGDDVDHGDAALSQPGVESGSLKPGALLLASPLGARTRPVSIAESLVHSLRLPSMSSADEETDEESGEGSEGGEDGGERATHAGDASGGHHSDAAVATGQGTSSAAVSAALVTDAARRDSGAAIASAQARYFGVGDAAEESDEGTSGADAERDVYHSSGSRQGRAAGSSNELEDAASPALRGVSLPTPLSVGRGRSLPGTSSVSGAGPASAPVDSSAEEEDSRDRGDFRSSRAALKQRAASAARSAASSAATSPLASDSPAAGRVHPRSSAHLDAPSAALAGAGASTFLTAMSSPDGGSSTDGFHHPLGGVASGPTATPLPPEQRPALAADDAAPESPYTPLSPVERSPAAKAPTYLAAALRGGGSSSTSTGAGSASAARGAEGVAPAVPAVSSAVEAAPGAAGEAEEGAYGDDYEDEGWEDASASTSQAQGQAQTQQATPASQLQAPAHTAVSPYARSTLVLPVMVSPPKAAATVVGAGVSVAPAIAKGLISVSQRPAGAAPAIGRRGHTGDSDDDADDFELFAPGDVDASGSGEGLGLGFEGAHGAYDGAGGSRGAGALPAASSPESGSGPAGSKAEAPRDDDADAPEVPDEEDLPDHDWF